MRYFLASFLLAATFFPVLSNAQTSNAGFVPENIWYSKDPFEEGDKIKIYTVLFNPDTRQFSGTVLFFDKSVFLGKKDFSIPSRTVKDISVDWTVTAGSHEIFAKIENAKFLVAPGKYQEVFLSDSQTEESERTVSKKVVAKTSAQGEDEQGGVLDEGVESVKNLGKLIEEKTPDIIAEPIVKAATSAESWREGVADSSLLKKAETRKEIETLDKEEDESAGGRLEKPFEYLRLFFFTLVSFIFGNPVLFYALILIPLFYGLRFLWRLVF